MIGCMVKNASATEQTIEQFGAQFARYPTVNHEGPITSPEFLLNSFGPLLDAAEVAGARVADIGSGTGRVVNWLLDLGASHVTAVEPSSSFEVLKANTAARADRISYINGRGEELPLGGFDLAFSVGVLMSIPDPDPVVARIFAALRPGGRFLAWLYAYEGNEIYLAFARPMRALTTRLPDPVLGALSHVFAAVLWPYIALCRWLPLPRHHHFREVMSRMTWRQRVLVIFDQLNPTWAEYYRRAEVERLIAKAGFEDVRLDHRHGYAWAVSGTKPAGSKSARSGDGRS